MELADPLTRKHTAKNRLMSASSGGRVAELSAITLCVLLLVFLVLTPVGFLAFGAFRSDGPGAPNAVFTIDNWRYAFGPWGRGYLANSVKLGVATSALAVPLGTLLAWLVTRTNMPARRLFSSVLLVPLLFSPLLTSLAWSGLAAPNSGLINVLARDVLGLRGTVFNVHSMAGLVLVLVLHYTPYVYLAVRPALSAMDRDMEDASSLLGAGIGGTLRRVTLPLMAPAILGSGVLVAVLAAENFSAVAILGAQANFLTIPYGIYEAFASFPSNPARGSALGLMLLGVTIAGMTIYLWAVRRSSRYVTVSGKGSRSNTRRLSAWGKLASSVVVGGYIALAIVLPYAMLMVGSFSDYFTVQGFSLDLLTLDNYRELFAGGRFTSALRNTAVLVLGAATAATGIGAFSAWISIRSKGRARKLVDYLTSFPIMIPGVALGLGMFWAYVFLPIGLYGTLTVLALAYMTRFMGHGARIVSSSLVQLSPDLEEAAQTLGSTRLQAYRKVTLRLLRGAFGASWILIAIFVSLEIPASIMLYTGSTVPASILVYLTMEGGIVSQAFAAGAVLATVSLGVTLIAQWRFRLFERL